jgi:Holliday junction resolvase RusA-like endonuclease
VICEFTVPGKAVGKGRPKAARRGAFITMYTPEATATYENLVKVKAQEAMAGKELTDEAVACRIEIVVIPPASWSMKRQTLALHGEEHPTTKPDIDNVVKGIFDAMNNIVWKDDKQVCQLSVSKHYGITPQVKVIVAKIEF